MSRQHIGGRGRTALGALLTAALVTSGAAGLTGTAVADQGSVRANGLLTKQVKAPKGNAKGKLGSVDQTKLATAKADGDRTVTAMIVTKSSTAKKVARNIVAAGGYIRLVDAGLGYVSAVVPTGTFEKTVVADSDVTAIDLDEVVTIPTPGDEAGGAGTAEGAYSAPDASTPDSNPYMPTKDTGSVAFKTAHPDWDGRGVTIGILDSGIDLDSPALRTTSTGEEKVTDWFTATDPVTEGDLVTGGDPTWLPMVQDATGPSFGPYRGATWTLPATGTYKIRTLD